MDHACCVCDAPDGKHCTKCKSRYYCGKACQVVDWKRGHNKACRQLAAVFQDRLLDELMPAKMNIKEEPAIVADVAPVDGSKAAARTPAARTGTTKDAKATALNDNAVDWRGTCAICLDLLPFDAPDGGKSGKTFYECCCNSICTVCSDKCRQHDERCPLCRAPASKSNAEWLRRLQKHVDKGNAEAQIMLGSRYSSGGPGIRQDLKRAVQLYELAAAQGNIRAQAQLGFIYFRGVGVKINYKKAAQWFRRAAEHGYPLAQSNFGEMFYEGRGVAQSYEEALKWFRLAAAQGERNGLYNLGRCYLEGYGVPQDLDEALRLFKRAAAKGSAEAAAAVGAVEALRV